MRVFVSASIATLLQFSTFAADAAIPLLGPCDPDFGAAAGCAPGNNKAERPIAPASAAKQPKLISPASAAPATSKTAPATKSTADVRAEAATPVSLPAEEPCSKTHRADAIEDAAPLVVLSPLVRP